VARNGRIDGTNRRSWSVTVRAATFVASIIAVGAYLAVAAALHFTPTWIGLGMLAISLVAAVTMVLTDRPDTPRLPAA
jgi:hypothetical protein